MNLFSVFPWIFITVLYSPIFYHLYRQRWEMVDYTHAYFILPVSLWLVWRKRNIIRDIAAESASTGNWTGIIFLIIGLLFFVLGWRKDYMFISSLSLIPVLGGLVLLLYGPQVL